MRRIATPAVAVLAALTGSSLAGPPSAGAQDLARVYRFTPTDAGAFEAALAKHAADRIEHGDPWGWDVLQVVVGQDLGKFLIRSGGHSWAEFDAYDEGFGAEAGLHYTVSVAPLVARVDMWITDEDTANSRLPTAAEWPEIDLIEVTTYHLRPGMEQEFDEIIGAIHEAIEAADWPARYAWVNTVAGVDGPRKVLAIFYDDWADFEQPETPFYQMLQEQMGEDETGRMMDELGETFRSVENSVLRLRRDLSVPPPDMREPGGR